MYRNEKWKTKFKSVFQRGCENEKRKPKGKSVFQSKAKNKIRKPKFKSVFQSDEKTKNKKRKSNPLFKVRRKTEYENRNSNPLFKMRRKRKTKNEIQIRCSMSQVDKTRKIKWNLNSIFLFHRKTVGTKVHTLKTNFRVKSSPLFLCLQVLSFAPRGFSLGSPVFPSPQKPTLPNSNSIWNARTLLPKKLFRHCQHWDFFFLKMGKDRRSDHVNFIWRLGKSVPHLSTSYCLKKHHQITHSSVKMLKWIKGSKRCTLTFCEKLKIG